MKTSGCSGGSNPGSSVSVNLSLRLHVTHALFEHLRFNQADFTQRQLFTASSPSAALTHGLKASESYRARLLVPPPTLLFALKTSTRGKVRTWLTVAFNQQVVNSSPWFFHPGE